jgi:hypothetical protein
LSIRICLLRMQIYRPSATALCFRRPHATKPVRIESVQNATDQARCLAARLIGKGAPYRSLRWFWSDQGSDKLQIVGLTHDVDRTVLRGSPETGSFSVFCYAGDRLFGIESVNRAADHAVGRKILERGGSVDPLSNPMTWQIRCAGMPGSSARRDKIRHSVMPIPKRLR